MPKMIRSVLLSAPVLAFALHPLSAQCRRTKPVQTVYLEIAGPPAYALPLNVQVTEPARQIARVAQPKDGRWTFYLTEPADLGSIKVEPARIHGYRAVSQGAPWLEPDKDRCAAVFPFAWQEVWSVTLVSDPPQMHATTELARNPKVVERRVQQTSFTVKDIPVEGFLTVRLHSRNSAEAWPIVLRGRDLTARTLNNAEVRRMLCADLHTPNACTGRMMRLGANSLTLRIEQ